MLMEILMGHFLNSLTKHFNPHSEMQHMIFGKSQKFFFRYHMPFLIEWIVNLWKVQYAKHANETYKISKPFSKIKYVFQYRDF